MKAILIVFLTALNLFAQSKVLVNQLGFSPNQPKYVFISEPSQKFVIKNSINNEIVFNGKFQFRISNDPASGLDLYEGDFSQFKTTGEYYIEADNGELSYTFKISETIYNDLYKHSLKAFHYQRCGFNISEKIAGKYAREACHLHDAKFHQSTDSSGFADVSGGWHDAGDYGKYIVSGASAAGMLLSAYELSPEKFENDNIGIEESNNGIPDILDEVIFELKWMLKMQKWNGAVYNKVHTKDYVGWVMPDKTDDIPRFIYEICTKSTASFAAIMAKGNRVLKAYDKEFAEKLFNAAMLSWEFLENNPNYLPEGGFKNPADTEAGGYTYSDDKNQRSWAAVELFETTGDKKYLFLTENYISELNEIKKPIGWDNIVPLSFITLITSNRLKKSLKDVVTDKIINYCDDQLAQTKIDGFRCTLKPAEYIWGTNGFVAAYGLTQVYAYELTKETKYINAAYNQLSYILGANCKSISFVSGFGKNSVANFHLATTASDNIELPMPGFLSGGPDKLLRDPVLKKMFNNSTPPAQTFVDDLDSYASNEVAIYWNAPLVFLAGYLSQFRD